MSISDEEISRRLQGLAHRVFDLVVEELGEPHLFVLLIQPYGQPGQEHVKRGMQYISNGEREHVATAFREMLENWERAGTMHVPPHKRQ